MAGVLAGSIPRGESYTDPEHNYRMAGSRGKKYVTITEMNPVPRPLITWTVVSPIR